MTHNFHHLEIWQASRQLVKEVYLKTKLLPPDERFGLTSQIRRSAVSIPSNIAEGCGRGTDKQLFQFLNYSIGSNCELETQIILAGDLEFISLADQQEIVEKIEKIRRKTINFQKRL